MLPVAGAAEQPSGTAAGPNNIMRFGVTPVVLDNQLQLNSMMASYLQEKTGHRVEIIQRQTYQEIINMLADGKLDFAWICGLPYARNQDWLRLVAEPLNGFNHGKPLYRSLVIVARDSPIREFQQLRGKRYAFADRDSNSGHLVPRYQLSEMGTDPEHFFSLAIYTNAHRNVVRAVTSGLVDGGSVDSYVLHMLQEYEPELASQVRVIDQSGEFAFPPIVAGKHVPPAWVQLLKEALLGMNEPGNMAGHKLLRSLHLAGFAPGQREDYNAIAAMNEAVSRLTESGVVKPSSERSQ